jgi:hypothetical protein
LDHHGIRDHADQVFCSADTGLAKPDPRNCQFVVTATETGSESTRIAERVRGGGAEVGDPQHRG